MTAIAFILDGLPPPWMFARLIAVCVCLPIISMVVSWFLIKRVKGGALWALIPAVIVACTIIGMALRLYDWGYPYFPTPDFWIGPVVAAEVPFAAILAITRHLESEGRTSRSSERA